MSDNYMVALRSKESVGRLREALAPHGPKPSASATVGWAVDTCLSMLEKRGAFFDVDTLADMMRRKTFAATVQNLESALTALHNDALFHVNGDADTGTVEVLRQAEAESRTVLLIERPSAAKDGTHDERPAYRATA